MTSYSLFQLNEYIRQVLALNLPDPLWVCCELAQVNAARGHYFIDLVEKENSRDEIIAQGQAVLWNREFRNLEQRLGTQLHALLQDGVEVLLLVKVEFHERYGLKLIIQDIDPAYTLGKLEMKRRETIRQLTQAGLLNLNKTIPLPPVLQRIAILTSESAAGYLDFLDQLHRNAFGYRFECHLFHVSVQGKYVEQEILQQLEKVVQRRQEYDCLVVIRGGGGRLDLSAFDKLELCKAMATCPIPVLAGIGHESDQSVLDMVCHTSLKTPTAVAEFIIQRSLQFENQTLKLALALKNIATNLLKDQALKIHYLWHAAHAQTRSHYQRQRQMLDYIAAEMPNLLRTYLSKEKWKLEMAEKSILLLSPETLLKRGFSLTLKDGKVVKDSAVLVAGEQVETHLSKGSFTSIVNKIDE